MMTCAAANKIMKIDLNQYSWIETNLRGFKTWEDEIKHMESLGYQLVPPDYRIPHWSELGTNPYLYVCGNGGVPREMNSFFDRPAAQIGYPLYFAKSNR